jgi:hypothetical protein
MYIRTEKAKKIDNMTALERGVALNNLKEELSDSFHHLKIKLMEKHITPEDINDYITLSYHMWVNAMLLQANNALQYEAGLLLVEKCVPLHKQDNTAISKLLSEELNKPNIGSFDKMTIMRGVYDILNDKYNQPCTKILQ